MRLCWLIPDDRGGGVATVAQSCCKQAANAGFDTTLLLVLKPTDWIENLHNFVVTSLGLESPATETPVALLSWLEQNPQDVLFLNGCEQADSIIPYLPPAVRCVYVVHDTAQRYWIQAIRQEMNLDAIVAVSETVDKQFRDRLLQPHRLFVIHNGCAFPDRLNHGNNRANDLLFLGGDKPIKGAYDLIKLWKTLVNMGFTGQLHWFGHMTIAFQKTIMKLPHTERIKVYGRTPRQQIFDVAEQTKVFLMLSRVEPFGMATIEAMSMGSVPVAWDIETGTKEIIKPQDTRCFAPLGDFVALARQVFHICEHYEDFGEYTINRARTHFAESHMWDGYAALLKTLDSSPLIKRTKIGQTPSPYKLPIRTFQLVPSPIRTKIREIVGHHPRLGYWVRNMRGF